MIFEGLGINLITPFSDTSEIDYDRMERLVDHALKAGANALILGGTSGEFQTMDNNEILTLIEFVVKKVEKRAKIIAQTGFSDTRRSIDLSIKAKELGVDALLLANPSYNMGNENGLESHFKSIALVSGLPCILHNDPDHTNYEYKLDILEKLAKIPNIVAMIDSSSNIENMIRIKASLPHNFQIIAANDKVLLPAMSLGLDAYISNLALILPTQARTIGQAYIDGVEIERARDLQTLYMKLIEALELEVNPVPIKTAMNMLGYDMGDFRLPLSTMNPDRAAHLAGLLIDMNVDKAANN
ncbi:4-hydroxy-tetrahydrodipicolinate synthase [Peptostreptococcus equinus]|uniref:4-hydroxy-tetrahydrodipicolinate synthase n=1 Tax=Peptostreptococcus equinus TaxID=3003601 RepID=A0ABY7JLZ1_9FIRM|nr:4-hydroxy-tetrahydrodipicolinate synthase [Peptostreptococcus sp. CBA3647]WAW14383.1 4-hydroxy-tetrahydrodipicolinate synthase [Peptostreptococcus sp. CBA3647]